jgi:glycosyltransferase involved in cell wall biosynthesis
MAKLKIAYIGQRGVPPTYGGVERYVDEIVKRLPKDEVETYTYCRRHYVKERVDYTKQIFAPSLKAQGFEAFSHSFFSSLDSLRHPFDIVHFQALGPSLFSFIPRLKRTKIVCTVHGLDWQRAKWGPAARTVIRSGDWMMGKAASGIISVSNNLKRYYENKYDKDVFYVPIGFSDPHIVEIDEIGRKFGLEKHKYILFLNRLVPEKGIHYLIEAFKNLKQTDFKLVIAGSATPGDKYVDGLKELAHDDSRIIFTGYVSRNEVHELYSNAYLFTLPSELEGMPAVVLEALSHRCPVLVSDIQEHLDIIQSAGQTYGFVHKNKDVSDLQDRLAFLLSHPEVVKPLRESGANYVNQEFSWDKAVRMTYDIYKQVAG